VTKVFTGLYCSLVFFPPHPVSHSYLSAEKLKLINMMFHDSVSVLYPVASCRWKLLFNVGLRHNNVAAVGYMNN